MPFNKILCPVDFSPGSQQAMRVAVQLATQHGAELVLVHSWYLPPLADASDLGISSDVVQQLSDDVKRGLELATAEAAKLGAKRVRSRLVAGLPWQQIVEVAKHEASELLVIGTHGRTGLARVLIGSVAEMVVRHAPCPVLAIRDDNEPRPFRKILCPIDFSASSRDAMNLAAELALPGRAAITLMHVLELPVSYSGELPLLPEYRRDADWRATALLEQWASELAAKTSLVVERQARVGWAGAEVLAVLGHDDSFDLVVMGSHGRTGVPRIVLGSVAEKVVRHAPCPVLVARRGE
jgi:nucleotide-binding universal stress UspA family protein